MIDHRVVDLARCIVSAIAPKQMATAQSRMELLDCLCIEYEHATRGRRDFDIRHVRSSLTFGRPHQTETAPGYRRRIFTIADKKKPRTRYPRVRASHSAVEDVKVPACG